VGASGLVAISTRVVAGRFVSAALLGHAVVTGTVVVATIGLAVATAVVTTLGAVVTTIGLAVPGLVVAA
jgi:hypothetical protein